MSKDNIFFSIQSLTSSTYSNKSIMAVGYFLININGISYGVKEKDATVLACSYDSVINRLKMRGKHIAPVDLIMLPGLKIAQLVRSILFDSTHNDQDDWKFNISHHDLADIIYKNNLLWAPDGDEAFDDGSNVLQFDIDNENVRLIGYKTTKENKVDISTLTDLLISSDKFYLSLKEWADGFYKDWQNSERSHRSVTLFKITG
jgi:PKD repeat protein